MATYVLTTDNDAFPGTGEADVFDGLYQGKTGGTDTLAGGDGSDTFDIGPYSSGSIDGGNGIDVVVLDGNNAFSIDSSPTLGTTKYSNVEILEIVDLHTFVSIDQLICFDTIRNPSYNIIRLTLIGQGGILDLSQRASTAHETEINGSMLTSGFQAHGTSGKDYMYGSSFDDIIYGDDGNDYLGKTITDTDSFDMFYGGAGNDTIALYECSGYLDGGSGNDYFQFQGGSGKIIGGSGIDTINTGDLGTTIILQIEILEVVGYVVKASIDQLSTFSKFTQYVDFFHDHGELTDFVLNGKGGSLDFSHSVDYGGVQVVADKLTSPITVVGTSARDLIGGTAFDDILSGGDKGDVLNGEGGSDTASYVGASAGLTANLEDAARNTGEAAGDTYSSIENLIGSSFADFLAGDFHSNALLGMDGADTLVGSRGNDDLDGGANPELGQPGAQGDIMLGGDGNDTYHVDSGLDLVDEDGYFPGYGNGGTDTIISTTDFYWDIASVGEIDIVSESVVDVNNDGVTIVGGVFDNTLIGHKGTDVLFGRGGNDTYRAGDGVDFISLSTLGVSDTSNYTADGHNTIIVDPRSSGPFSYDIVFEFDPAKDKIDVSNYGGVSNYTSAAQVLSHAVDDGAGNCYIVLGDGLDYLYLVGVVKAQLLTTDFIV